MSTSQGKNYPDDRRDRRPPEPYGRNGRPTGYGRDGYDAYDDRAGRPHQTAPNRVGWDDEGTRRAPGRQGPRPYRDEDPARRGGQPSRGAAHGKVDLATEQKLRRARMMHLHKVVCIVLTVLLMFSSAGYGVVQNVLGNLTRVSDGQQTQQLISDSDIELGNVSDSDTFTLPDGAVISNDDVDIVLLVGSDQRLGTGKPARSDTMMLVIIDRVHEKLKVVSIMRDLYAPITGDGRKLGSNKINFAFYYDSAYGNMDLRITRETIKNCFGIEIDNFAVVDFMMFRTLINRLDGVEVEFTKAMAKYMDDRGLWSSEANIGKREAGSYLLNGSEALNYVRMRYVGEGDFDRTRRQRNLLNLILNKVKSMDYTEIMYHTTGILPFITTDFTDGQIMGYAFQAADILKYEVVQLSFPINGAWRFGWATIGYTNVSILLTNFEFCSSALRSFIYDDDMTYTKDGAKAKGVWIPTVTTKFGPSTESSMMEESSTTVDSSTTSTDSSASESSATTAATTAATTTSTTTAVVPVIG